MGYSMESTRFRKTIRIYVNGLALDYYWNNFKTKHDALSMIASGRVSNCSVLRDTIEIVEETQEVSSVNYESM